MTDTALLWLYTPTPGATAEINLGMGVADRTSDSVTFAFLTINGLSYHISRCFDVATSTLTFRMGSLSANTVICNSMFFLILNHRHVVKITRVMFIWRIEVKRSCIRKYYFHIRQPGSVRYKHSYQYNKVCNFAFKTVKNVFMRLIITSGTCPSVRIPVPQELLLPEYSYGKALNT